MKHVQKKAQRETVGKISSDLLWSEPSKQDPVETADEMLKKVNETFFKALTSTKKKYPDHSFYIVIHIRKHKIMPNVLDVLPETRLSCPTPNNDTMVWYYNKSDDSVKELWVIPDPETVMIYKTNAMHVEPHERQLLQYILDFEDGTLLKKCKELNGEKPDSVFLLLNH